MTLFWLHLGFSIPRSVARFSGSLPFKSSLMHQRLGHRARQRPAARALSRV